MNGKKPMRILILDDDDRRHSAYDVMYAGHEIEHAYNYIAFLDAIYEGSPWDIVYLDHDLGDHISGDTYVDGWGNSREYNGVHAANRICELVDDQLPKNVIIQSINPHGARVMLNILERRGLNVEWSPFSEINREKRKTNKKENDANRDEE